MPEVTPDSMQARNKARSVNQKSVLRFRENHYTADRRSYPNGLRRSPHIVFTCKETDTEIFYDGRGDFLAVLPDGTEFFLVVEQVTDKGAVVVSKK